MAKTAEEIAAKVLEIYDLARVSETPISVISVHNVALQAESDWTPLEIEQISQNVLNMVIRDHWKTAAEAPRP